MFGGYGVRIAWIPLHHKAIYTIWYHIYIYQTRYITRGF